MKVKKIETIHSSGDSQRCYILRLNVSCFHKIPFIKLHSISHNLIIYFHDYNVFITLFLSDIFLDLYQLKIKFSSHYMSTRDFLKFWNSLLKYFNCVWEKKKSATRPLRNTAQIFTFLCQIQISSKLLDWNMSARNLRFFFVKFALLLKKKNRSRVIQSVSNKQIHEEFNGSL